MTENTTAAFAPALPSLYSSSYSAESELIPSYTRTKVFNHDLTTEQLKPLLDGCPTPGRRLRRIGGIVFLSAYALIGISLLAAQVIVRLHAPGDFLTYEQMDAGAQVFGLVTVTGAATWLTGVVLDFVAWKRWVAGLLGAWKLHAGHLIRVRDLPADRQRNVSSLGERLDAALKDLDASDPAAQHLNLAARAAIGRYFEFPEISEEVRRVAKSAVTDPSVQRIRAWYEADTATEKASLLEAEAAVRTVSDYVETTKTAAAEKEIVRLARIIAGSSS